LSATQSFSITVDDSQVQAMLNNLNQKLNNPTEGLLNAVDISAIPALRAQSSTDWNVRTGLYSNGWIAEPQGQQAISIGDLAPYAGFLESGFRQWNTHKTIAGKHTLVNTMTRVLPDILNSFIQWLVSMD
jgi:hypothetical protein